MVVRSWPMIAAALDAVAGHVADHQCHLAVVERDDVEPVAADLRGPAGRLVAVGDVEACHLRDVAGQQAALQGHRRVVLAGVQPGVVDVHRRPRGRSVTSRTSASSYGPGSQPG